MFFFFGVCACVPESVKLLFFFSVSGVGLSSSPGDSEIFLPFLDSGGKGEEQEIFLER